MNEVKKKLLTVLQPLLDWLQIFYSRKFKKIEMQVAQEENLESTEDFKDYFSKDNTGK